MSAAARVHAPILAETTPLTIALVAAPRSLWFTALSPFSRTDGCTRPLAPPPGMIPPSRRLLSPFSPAYPRPQSDKRISCSASPVAGPTFVGSACWWCRRRTIVLRGGGGVGGSVKARQSRESGATLGGGLESNPGLRLSTPLLLTPRLREPAQTPHPRDAVRGTMGILRHRNCLLWQRGRGGH